MNNGNEVEKEFSKHANEYDSYNIIQQIVSKALVREMTAEPKRILELGCGSGQVFKNIDFPFEYYKAIDFSKTMCDIHPKAENLEIVCLNFDSEEFFENISGESYDLVLSSSALQWSKDLKKIVKALSEISEEVNAVLFTSNTFKKIFELTGTVSPILGEQTIKEAFESCFSCRFETIKYNLEFETKKKLFDYIKNSGVRGSSKELSYKEAKHLYKNYDLEYLEFEVIFVKGKRKTK